MGTKWTPLVEDDNNETSMVTTNKKPKVPTPTRMNADHTWSTTDKFDNWVLEVLDYLVIYRVDPERGREAIAYTSGYLEGVAKEFLRTWREKPENGVRSLTDFLYQLTIKTSFRKYLQKSDRQQGTNRDLSKR